VFFDFGEGGGFAEAFGVLVFAALFAPFVVGFGDFGDVFVRENAVGFVFHVAEFACVDEENFAGAFAVAVACSFAGKEPEAGGDSGVVKELGGKGNDAVHQIVLDDCFADFSFTGRVGRK